MVCAFAILVAVLAAEPTTFPGKVYFIQPTERLPNFDALEPVVRTIYTNPLSVGPVKAMPGFPGISDRSQWFAIDYQGKIYVRRPGIYRFRLVSDDGSKLYIDDLNVIDNDRGLGAWSADKAVKLSGGMHRLRLSYFQGPANHYYITLVLSVSPPSSKRFSPFDIRDFAPPSGSDDWPFGSPADFAPDPDPNAGRVRLRDVVSKKNVDEGTVVASVRSELRPPRDASSKLPVPTEDQPFQFPHPPTPDDQKQFIETVRSMALQYRASLPDFICNQVISRSVMTAPITQWIPRDVLNVQLTYFADRENYSLTSIDGHATKETYESAGGAVFERDFGTPFLQIFSPAAQTAFQWHHWTLLRKRLTQVYSYRTLPERSTYKIGAVIGTGPKVETIAGRHGFIYVDLETHMVTRIAGESDSLPADFPISAQSNVLDYDYAEVGGRRFLLPLRAYQELSTGAKRYRNTTDFRDYRKFIGESTISFDQHQ